MAAKHEQNYTVNASIEQLRAIILDAQFASELRIALKSENTEQNRIWYRFHHGTTMTSWGEKITITLSPLQNGTTVLNIHSECGMPTQIVDWGKNKKIVENIFACIDKRLRHNPIAPQTPAPTPSMASTPYITPPVANPSPDLVAKFCKNCGKPLDGPANFCKFCGAKL